MYQKVLATCLFVVALCLGGNVQAYVFDHNPPPPEPYVVADDLPDGNYMGVALDITKYKVSLFRS